MKLQKTLKNALFIISAFLATVPRAAYAEEQYSYSYPPRMNNIPAFYISRIDPTNNQLEFTLNTLEGKTPSKFGAAWIRVRADEYLNADVRNFESVEYSWAEKVFWSDDYNLDLESYHSGDDSFLKHYTVDTILDIKNNTFKDMYFIMETTDGDKWVDKVSYGDCGYAWTEGKACVGEMFKNDTESDSVIYELRDAPDKFLKTDIIKNVDYGNIDNDIDDNASIEDQKENTDTNTNIDVNNNVNTELNNLNDVNIDKNNSNKNLNNIEAEDIVTKNNDISEITDLDSSIDDVVEINEVSENDVKDEAMLDDDVAAVTMQELANNDINGEKDMSLEADGALVEQGDDSGGFDIENINEIEDVTDDFTEEYESVNEGFGDTTLDVPLLGQVVDEPGDESLDCEYCNKMLYFILGGLIGVVSTWSLLFIIKKISTKRTD